ncbi:TlpA family protein disulfide reductase [Streptomyces decoyicus]|uniref:TlpA family protein disulfide reductase n=1 Tax=Streptomyces decoyicus TaxID=249567 RepID=UPI0037F24C92
MKTPPRIIVLSLAALTVVALGVGMIAAHDDPGTRKGYHQGKGGVLTIEARHRPQARGFTGSGLDGKQALKLPQGILNAQGLPFTFAIDPRGKVAAASSGPLDEAKIDALVKAAQAGTAPAGHGS